MINKIRIGHHALNIVHVHNEGGDHHLESTHVFYQGRAELFWQLLHKKNYAKKPSCLSHSYMSWMRMEYTSDLAIKTSGY